MIRRSYVHFQCISSAASLPRDVAAAPQTPQLGGGQANFGGPS